MARRVVSLTTDWQLLSSNKAVFTVSATEVQGGIMFNDVASDVAAHQIGGITKGQQIIQRSVRLTYAKAISGTKWKIIIDD